MKITGVILRDLMCDTWSSMSAEWLTTNYKLFTKDMYNFMASTFKENEYINDEGHLDCVKILDDWFIAFSENEKNKILNEYENLKVYTTESKEIFYLRREK